jgi:hypothetical protein
MSPRQVDNKNRIHGAQIKVYDYQELVSVIRMLIKFCIVALDQDGAEVPITIKISQLTSGLYWELPCSYFPIDEFELLNEISILFPADSRKEDENIVKD